MARLILPELGVGGFGAGDIKRASQLNRVLDFVGAPPGVAPRCTHRERVLRLHRWIDEHQSISQPGRHSRRHRRLARGGLGQQGHADLLCQAGFGQHLRFKAGVAGQAHFDTLLHRG